MEEMPEREEEDLESEEEFPLDREIDSEECED